MATVVFSWSVFVGPSFINLQPLIGLKVWNWKSEERKFIILTFLVLTWHSLDTIDFFKAATASSTRWYTCEPFEIVMKESVIETDKRKRENIFLCIILSVMLIDREENRWWKFHMMVWGGVRTVHSIDGSYTKEHLAYNETTAPYLLHWL